MPIYSVQGQQVEDLMMVLFLGQDSARYELSLKTENFIYLFLPRPEPDPVLCS